MKTALEQLMTGLDEVEAFLAGQNKGFKVHVPDEVDVKSIRNKLGMTQACFSDTFGFSLDAIKHWEGGRRKPEAPARTLLTVIDKNPGAVISALQPQVLAQPRSNRPVVRVKARKASARVEKTGNGKRLRLRAVGAGNLGAREEP